MKKFKNMKYSVSIGWAVSVFAFALSCLVSPQAMGDTIAYWRFEENAVSEINPEAFTGELSPTASFSEDVPAAVLQVNGEELSNHYSYSNGSSEDGTWMDYSDLLNDVMGMDSFTIEGFVQLDHGAGTLKHMRIIGTMYPKSKPTGWAVGVSLGKLVFGALQGANSHTFNPARIESGKALSEGKWHHFAIVGLRDPKMIDVKFYIDGEEVESDNLNLYSEGIGQNAIVATENPIRIASPNPFQGKIDELRISDVPLDPSDFLQVTPK